LFFNWGFGGKYETLSHLFVFFLFLLPFYGLPFFGFTALAYFLLFSCFLQSFLLLSARVCEKFRFRVFFFPFPYRTGSLFSPTALPPAAIGARFFLEL
jgi:hypothetical protein